MKDGLHLSIVSHRQADLVATLLADLAPFAAKHAMRITLTSNVPEAPPAVPRELAGIVKQVDNKGQPRGFGENHNRAFEDVSAPFFCVLNPDLRMPADPFPALLEAFDDPRVALAAPAALDPAGSLQDNARRLPRPLDVLRRFWSPGGPPDYPAARTTEVEVVAGFFMLFRSAAFRSLGGFDQRYFLYYEDFDLCCRLRAAGGAIAWVPQARVVHDARRASHRSLQYFSWHAASVLRFFSSPAYRAAKRLPPPR